MIDAVILSAGFGKRLLPITKKYQKVALGIYGIPPVIYQLYNLKKKGISRFFINIHHNPLLLKETINKLAPDDIEIIYSEENEILGTGGGIYRLKDQLSEDFLIINGDSYLNIDLKAFIRDYRENKQLALLMLGKRKGKIISGLMANNGYIKEIDIKKIKNLPYMFYGCHILNKEIFNHFTKYHYSDIILDVYMGLLNKDLIRAHITDELLFDIGTFENIRHGLNTLLENNFDLLNIKDFVNYDKSGNSIYFISSGPSNAIIRNSAISYDVHIEEGANIINSIIMQNNHIKQGQILKDSIVPPMTYGE